jgi:hypothetical protein
LRRKRGNGWPVLRKSLSSNRSRSEAFDTVEFFRGREVRAVEAPQESARRPHALHRQLWCRRTGQRLRQAAFRRPAGLRGRGLSRGRIPAPRFHPERQSKSMNYARTPSCHPAERANPTSADSFLSHAGTNGLASAGADLRPNHHPMLAPDEGRRWAPAPHPYANRAGTRKGRPDSQFPTVPNVYRISVTLSSYFLPIRLLFTQTTCSLWPYTSTVRKPWRGVSEPLAELASNRSAVASLQP